jgi:hypothetical protein
MELLKFNQGNRKLDKFTTTLSLPAGYSCPAALYCHSWCDKKTGKVKDGRFCQFRCASAFIEALFPCVKKQRWYNFNLIKQCKTTKKITELICNSLPEKAIKVRPGVSGDFFNQSYFDAWMDVAREYPKTLFYAYTKSIPFWLNRKNSIPKNFKLTASYGGKYDYLIKPNGLKWTMVVYSPKEAKALGLEIDHNDQHAYDGKKNFALLLHSPQPAKSEACKAYFQLKKDGIAGYGNHKQKRLLVL